MFQGIFFEILEPPISLLNTITSTVSDAIDFAKDMVPTKPVALTPSVGGLCIDPRAVRSADIIVSTTKAFGSGFIRVGTMAVVSHVALAVANDAVVEAVMDKGVVRNSLTDALSDDVLAVVFRHPKMTAGIAARISAWATSQVGKAYSASGAVASGMGIACRVRGSGDGTFFCSQFVFEAFKQGGLPLSSMPAQCVNPGEAVDILEKDLNYVGHLKGDPAWLPIIAP